MSYLSSKIVGFLSSYCILDISNFQSPNDTKDIMIEIFKGLIALLSGVLVGWLSKKLEKKEK